MDRFEQLRAALLVAGNDTLIRFQHRASLAFIVILPLALTLIMGFAIRSWEPRASPVRLALVDQDAGPISQRFGQAIDDLSGSPAQTAVGHDPGRTPAGAQARFSLRLTLDEARRQLSNGELDGVIVLPPGLSAQLAKEEPVRIEVLLAAGESVQRAATEATVDRLVHQVSRRNPLPLDWQAVSDTDDRRLVAGFSSFTQSVAGNGVMFILLNCMANGGLAILYEKRQHTLARLMISPLTPGAILFGKTVGVFLVGVAQAIVIFGFGVLVGVQLGSVLGVTLVTLVFVFVGSALGLAVSAIARREEAVQMICTPVALIMTALGGGMFPIEVAPDWLKPVSLFFPTGWAMDGYHKLMWDGHAWTSVLPNVGVLAGFAVVFFVIGIASLRWDP
jgi:ABC-2 type transport system permease protein